MWNSEGRLIWAKDGFVAGTLYDFSPELQTVAEKRESKVMEPGDDVPTPHEGSAAGAHTASGSTDELLEVYVGAGDPDGRFMFEAHAPHRYACAGPATVRFTMVVLDPGNADLVPPTSIAPASPE